MRAVFMAHRPLQIQMDNAHRGTDRTLCTHDCKLGEDFHAHFSWDFLIGLLPDP